MNSDSIIKPSIYSNDFSMCDVKSMCVWLKEQALYLTYSDPKISLRLGFILHFAIHWYPPLNICFTLAFYMYFGFWLNWLLGLFLLNSKLENFYSFRLLLAVKYRPTLSDQSLLADIPNLTWNGTLWSHSKHQTQSSFFSITLFLSLGIKGDFFIYHQC